VPISNGLHPERVPESSARFPKPPAVLRPFQGRVVLGTFSGGSRSRSSLDPRLIAVSPPGWGGGSRTSNNHFTRDVLRADGTRAYVGYSVDSLTVGLVAVCRVKFAGETRDAVAHLYPTAEEARITCAIVDAAAKVRDLNFKYMSEGKGATVTARFGPDGITICDPNRA